MPKHARALALAAAAVLAVVLTGCGGSSAGSTPTSPPATSAAVDGPTVPTGPAPRPVKGYTIKAASENATSAFQALVTSSQGGFKSMSASTVSKGSTEVGGLVIFDVDPTVVLGPEAGEVLTTALVKKLSGQSTVKERMFGGLRIVSATSGSSTVTAWFNGDVITAVLGHDAAAVKAFVDASLVG